MQFFTVTRRSIYLVQDRVDEKGTPIVEKIASRGESDIPIGARLMGGRSVGITPERIVLFDGRPGQKPEQVNIVHWGGQISPPVALFLDKEGAEACLSSSDLKWCDSRWEKETKEVLDSIGNNNPILVVSYWSTDPLRFHFPS